jgi:hypothetical protein
VLWPGLQAAFADALAAQLHVKEGQSLSLAEFEKLAFEGARVPSADPAPLPFPGTALFNAGAGGAAGATAPVRLLMALGTGLRAVLHCCAQTEREVGQLAEANEELQVPASCTAPPATLLLL